MEKKHLKIFLLISFIVCYIIPVFSQTPSFLRCEYLINPIGIDCTSPRLTWMLNDSRPGALQKAYRLKIGTDSVAVLSGKGNVWDSGKVLSDKILVSYNGQPLIPFTRYYWCVETWDKGNAVYKSSFAYFETGMMKQNNWKGSWISDGNGNFGKGIKEKAAPYFRKEINISSPIVSARAYIAVAGLYELSVNGKRIGNRQLDPMFTRYDRRNLYATYDITDFLKNGENAVGVWLGNGWYNLQSTAVWYFDKAPWRNRPAFCMDIRITYKDGSVKTISTDNKWKTSLSPLVFNSIYTGEHYDARKIQNGWNKPEFDDSKWTNVLVRPAPSQNIVSEQIQPIRRVEKICPKSIRKIDEKTWLFDFGQNISGVTRLSVKGEKGTTFTLKHGEEMKDGRIDMSNLDAHYRPTDDTDPFGTDIYILGGGGEETFSPHFNYKGFQYVEVTCDRPFTLAADNLTAFFTHSDVPPVGKVMTSNPLINKIWEAANRSYLSNLIGIPTDCPHREKNGWTGDAHIAIETGLYNFDGITVYEKWMADHQDEQQPNGVLPAIIPTSGWGYHWANGLDWTSTIAIIPWNIYMFYGDSHLLKSCYENIKLYVDHVSDKYPDGLTDWGLGDWVPVKSKTPVEFTSSIYYYVDAKILSDAAKIFGKQEDSKKYSALAEKIKTALNKKYLNVETGVYGEGNQTELSFPLFWGLVPNELKLKVAGQLAKRVTADNNHLDVGLLGSESLLNALSDNGYADLAYTIASQKDYPSWGMWIENGATTLFEDWKSVSSTDGKIKSSLNHIMFGEIDAWFYKALGGIHPDFLQPGFKNILLRPNFITNLEHVKVQYRSPYGEITSQWEHKGKKVIYKVVIPPNSTASMTVPQGYRLIKAKVGGEKIDLESSSKDLYLLQSGHYIIELTRK